MIDDIHKIIESIPANPESKDTLINQIYSLMVIGNHLGLYQAIDFLVNQIPEIQKSRFQIPGEYNTPIHQYTNQE